MKRIKRLIAAACPRYACRVCRTKTGWPHQCWCTLSTLLEPSCADCRYVQETDGSCTHPANRKAGEPA